MAAKSGGSTVARPGDRIVVESERVGQRAREGEILEITHSRIGVSYEVRWEDGHRSSFRPASGSAQIIPVARRRASPR